MKKVFLLFCVFIVFLPSKSANYVITDYGVGIDSTHINTTAIQSVIDRASANGGGIIVVPKGVFLSGALFFKPNTKLVLEEGAVLKGSDNIVDYPLIPSRMEGKCLNYYAALINAYKVDNFSIKGPGTINGNGLNYWKTFWANRDSLKKQGREATNLEVHRPRLLFIWGCNNVSISNVKLCNSGFWTTHLYQCNDVLIENCDIRSPFAPVKAPSTDGVDIDVCKRVTIRKCYISVNDDAVCIKGGKGPDAQNCSDNGIVEDVLVEDCAFGESHSALTLGSESIHARNITMRNCKINSNTPMLRLKMRPDTYQIFEDITVENITGKCGTIINLRPWTQFFTMEGSNEKPYGIVRNISISNIKVKCNSFGEIAGNPSDIISNIQFRNIEATAKEPLLKCKYPEIKIENVIVNGAPLVVKKQISK
jgi:polygalacturonase